MARLRRLLAEVRTDPALLARAAAVILLLRIALAVLPFPLLRRLVHALGRPGRGAPAAPERVARAVTRVARGIPRATCLVQALAVQVLLRRQGAAATVWIGVHRDASGRLRSHAWTEAAGRIVIGDGAAESYTPLTAWDAPPR